MKNAAQKENIESVPADLLDCSCKIFETQQLQAENWIFVSFCSSDKHTQEKNCCTGILETFALLPKGTWRDMHWK